MSTYITTKAINRALDALERKRRELEERITIIKQGETARVQLLAYCKKNGFGRGDIHWVWTQLPLTRITKKSRLRALAEGNKTDVIKPAIFARNKNRKKPVPKPELVPIGARLRSLRTSAGLTSYKLADKVGVDGSMITCWERGIWRMKPEIIAKIEKVLGSKLKENE